MALHAILALVLLAPLACSGRGEAPNEVPVRVSLILRDAQNTPVLILEEAAGARMLPISIGAAEASSIAAEMHHERPARPNSHDFAARLITGLDGELLRVVVTEIHAGTFYAILVLGVGGKRIEIDARPSDAIATALRAGAPILVREQVFEEAGQPPADDADREAIAGAAPAGSSPATRAVEL